MLSVLQVAALCPRALMTPTLPGQVDEQFHCGGMMPDVLVID
jgi:hypothetical protein